MYSQNFSFSPGYGLPGRVYSSRKPFWQSNLSKLDVDQFARVGGAAIYGVETALGLPVMTPVGVMVAVVYSCSNIPNDAYWEKQCTDFFKTLQPEPRWKLVIDVGLKNPAEENVEVENVNYADSDDKPRAVSVSGSSPKTSASTASLVVPESPIPAARIAVKSDVPIKQEASYVWNEQSLALLIGKYMPLDPSSANLSLSNLALGNPTFASDLVSLRLLLLRHISCRTSFEISLVNVIMKKYQSYIQAKHTEYEIMNFIMNDWKYLAASNHSGTVTGGGSTPPAPANQTNVNNFNSADAPSSTLGYNSSSVPRVVSESGPIKQDMDGC